MNSRVWSQVWFKSCLGLLAVLALAPTIGLYAQEQPKGDLEVRYLAKGKKVIPVDCQIGSWKIVDIKLPDLVVTNKGKNELSIDGIEVTGTAKGQDVLTLKIPRDEFAASIGKMSAMLNTNRLPLFALQAGYGNIDLPEGLFPESATLKPGQSVVVTLSKMAYLHYVGNGTIDGMNITLSAKAGDKGAEMTKTVFPVPVTPYEAKGKYIFPLKGDLHVAFTPLSYIHHRGSTSQEFGMDVVDAAQKGCQDFTAISLPEPKKLADYGIWGKDVMAIGDGTVVDMGDKFPEARMSDPALFSKPGYTPALLKELLPTIGSLNALCGNYVTIDHGNGEFSVYAHLKEGSIKVKQGDAVKKGAVIGQVGNTGNSGAPHLHFQLMDSKEFFTANSLPLNFENVPGSAIISEFPVKTNTLCFSDNLFFSIP